MSTISQIIYDKRTKKYRVRMGDSSGAQIESLQQFDTAAEADAWLDARLKEVGASPGQPMPLRNN